MLIIPMVIIPIIIAGSLSAILWSGGEQFAFKWLNPRGSHHSHGDPGLIIFNSWLIILSELFVQSFSVQRTLWEFLECIIFWMIFPSQGLYQNFLNELSFEWFFRPLVFMQLFEYLCNYLNIYAIIWIIFWTISPPNKGLHARDHDGRNGLLQPYVNRRSLIASSKAKYIILQTASVSWTL